MSGVPFISRRIGFSEIACSTFCFSSGSAAMESLAAAPPPYTLVSVLKHLIHIPE
jgi:hypothetical protein